MPAAQKSPLTMAKDRTVFAQVILDITRAVDLIATRMTVIGTGYLGATHAACMAELGRK